MQYHTPHRYHAQYPVPFITIPYHTSRVSQTVRAAQRNNSRSNVDVSLECQGTTRTRHGMDGWGECDGYDGDLVVDGYDGDEVVVVV